MVVETGGHRAYKLVRSLRLILGVAPVRRGISCGISAADQV